MRQQTSMQFGSGNPPPPSWGRWCQSRYRGIQLEGRIFFRGDFQALLTFAQVIRKVIRGKRVRLPLVGLQTLSPGDLQLKVSLAFRLSRKWKFIVPHNPLQSLLPPPRPGTIGVARKRKGRPIRSCISRTQGGIKEKLKGVRPSLWGKFLSYKILNLLLLIQWLNRFLDYIRKSRHILIYFIFCV